MKPLFIISGADGHLGNTIIHYLIQQNVAIRGLILPHHKRKYANDVTYIEGDIRQIETLQDLFKNTSGYQVFVIHTAGLISIDDEVSSDLYQVNVLGTQNILELSLKNHVHRFLYVSSVHAMKECPGIMSETNIYSPDDVDGGYAKTKADATTLVIEAIKQGLNASIVLPSGIIGPYGDTSNHLVQLIDSYIHYHLFFCVKGGYDFVDVRDVAKGCLLAVEYGKKGESYILSNQHYEIKDILKMSKKLYGGSPIIMIPLFLAKGLLPFIRFVSKKNHTRPLYTKYSLRVLNSHCRFSHGKASQNFGYTTRSIEETLNDTILWIVKGKS
ncbi:MAG: NAD-dependent epimerase/dehydratase family protein [Longibaculum sp.]